MIGPRLVNSRVAGVLVLVLLSGSSLPQVDNFLEEDSSPDLEETEASTAEVAQSNDSSLDLTILFKKLSDLENENRFLVGRIEQLEHEFEQFLHENRARYKELDDRVRGLSGQAILQADGPDGGSFDQGTEEGTYQQAILYIQDQKYEEAISSLREMIATYPNGRRVADGFYYLGELYLTIEPKNLERARQNYAMLVRLYDQHTKIPEAKYKLGTIYDELDDRVTALEFLDEVVQEYPGTSAARLAKEYADTVRELEALQVPTE